MLGFFYSRRPLEGPGDGAGDDPGFWRFANVPDLVGLVVAAGLATLHELETVYGSEDLYDMVEILAVDAHNKNIQVK